MWQEIPQVTWSISNKNAVEPLYKNDWNLRMKNLWQGIIDDAKYKFFLHNMSKYGDRKFYIFHW